MESCTFDTAVVSFVAVIPIVHFTQHFSCLYLDTWQHRHSLLEQHD